MPLLLPSFHVELSWRRKTDVGTKFLIYQSLKKPEVVRDFQWIVG